MTPSDMQKKFPANTVIMRQGEAGNRAYIIEEGLVKIVVEHPNGKRQNVGTRGPGSMIGEMALVDGAPRTATVTAIEDCTLLPITQEDFSNRLKNSDPVLKMTTQVILARYRDVLERAEIRDDDHGWSSTESSEKNHANYSNAVESIKISAEFSEALKNGEICLHYQPMVNFDTGEVKGFEALMRWQHPEKGFIPPDVFIPIIEDSGLIVEASNWALREACKALKRIEGTTGKTEKLYMSVNFSSQDFSSESFVSSLYDILSETDIKPEQLHLEITERILMGQPENAKATLNMCADAGVKIAIDDFGTGYSSLSYLHKFPIDILKIDQSFVRDMDKDESSAELVKSIVMLGKNLKMSLVAEGVETKEEAQILHGLGCDRAQGYFYARPMPENEVIEALHKWEAIKI